MSQQIRAIGALMVACTIWGLSTVYYKQLSHVPALEVLSHRTLWSVLFFLIWLATTGRLHRLRQAVGRGRRIWPVLAASLMISTNWFGYIYSVQIGNALESSLGYYIFPLVTVATGFVIFGERFGGLQSLAIGIATLAVVILAVGLGVAPWVALLLASTMAIYGALKKISGLDPMISVVLEVILLLPLALIWLYGAHALGWQGVRQIPGGAFGADWQSTALLMLAGPLTGLPLMLFSYAAPRLTLSTLGLVQYLNPTLQFATAVAVLGEAFTLWHGIAFPLIWLALGIYSWSAWRRDQAKPSKTASGLSTT